jgi:hypothetical protein
VDPPPVRYQSSDEDSGRWLEFVFRPGDIVISTRSKSGTTWMQMICALLVFRTPDLPLPLAELSPWLDWLGTPQHDVYRQLAAQNHRRFIKTHTPLDGLPLDERATFIVVARHPLDMAVSLYHQGDNLDRERISELTGAPVVQDPSRGDLRSWLLRWIAWDGDRAGRLDSLPGVLWHLTDAWSRRSDANVVLVHYDDLIADLPAEMKKLAARLGFAIEPELIEQLASAATFEAMKANSDVLAPDLAGVLKDRARFFRRGASGSAAEVLTTDELALYRIRSAALAPADLLSWLHRD